MNVEKAFEISSRMSALQRYSQIKLMCRESVMEHTGFVCFFSYLMCKEQGLDAIDTGQVMSKAVVHDIDEIITGDIPRPTKYHNEELTRQIKKVEDDNMKEVANDLLVPGIYDDWAAAKDFSTGLIVAIADAIAVAYKAWHEYQIYSNRSILETIESVEKGLEKHKRSVIGIYGSTSPIINIIDEVTEILEECK